MESYKVSTPEGTRDRFFAECEELREIRAAIVRLFRGRGYREVSTPSLEYYDLFMRVGSPLPQESMLKLADHSGSILVLRPDCTTPIARVAATRLSELPLPLRLYYDQNIYRSGAVNTGNSCEIAQCGIELIGAEGLRADIEAVLMAVNALQAAGASSFRIELGHRGFFQALISELLASSETILDNDGIEKLRDCIAVKNIALLSDLLKAYSCPAAKALSHLPWLFGGIEVLNEAEKLTSNSEALAAIAYLKRIYSELDAAGLSGYLSFDLGLVQDLDYYTGIIFRGYIRGAGSFVLAGGRYDSLIESFGRSLPATGFAVYADALAALIDNKPFQETDTVVYYEEGCLSLALDIMAALPEGSAELSHCSNESEARENARAKGAVRLLIAGQKGVREVELNG
jgi:ATP phosphoribosyltransferase regulatory subunit